MLTGQARHFLDHHRVARFATADPGGQPHIVPICYAVSGDSVYFTIDEKPKRLTDKPLKRIRNLQQNPHVALVVDRYDEDWTRLGWVMVQGEAALLDNGEEHSKAQRLLKARYPQLDEMQISELPVIAIRIKRVVSWGNLGTD
ncbi:MAG TPA: TIGR03668 family PPOX class F420-dependent oxidoreductase [Gammaproteobacteria bacterium]|jgi:PPOX class probable F420-dependent enzyme|nr:MAG: TIGR03668 family PPOX class F420-dependent oxidoreductase [Gammaproteobacteria bacterium]HAD36095.1 TIGR03668 family PPOX class F420-dependent oxidoreductase [Gammaproteobacteria bacterium]HBK75472.1 TIGR03668 family PPOX class F420-dependent oxidoreductase [Gammaproteobacteria bacterium]HHZ72002.1 TIGR03668 family PPOX class F420-dependent oxidoreductase [Gammaproteobacteria bacterium]HIB07554.1 TIGR03668 family PPOX class F420-dependent oxidoreductase [Gammaproteobacteria bacterium]